MPPARGRRTPEETVRPVRPDRLAKPKLLLGEGKDELMFFQAFLEHLGIGDVQVEQYGGKARLRGFLEALVRRPGFEELTSLGITRDADSHAAGAFRSVCDALRRNQLPVPSAVKRPLGGPPRVAVHIFPGRGRKGMLEDLCFAAVSGDKGAECVKEFLQCVKTRARRRPRNLSKARVHAWLASQVEPDLRLGEAAHKGYWPWEHAAFAGVRKFLRRL